MELKANKVQLKGIFDKCTSLYKETSFNLQSIQNKTKDIMLNSFINVDNFNYDESYNELNAIFKTLHFLNRSITEKRTSTPNNKENVEHFKLYETSHPERDQFLFSYTRFISKIYKPGFKGACLISHILNAEKGLLFIIDTDMYKSHNEILSSIQKVDQTQTYQQPPIENTIFGYYSNSESYIFRAIIKGYIKDTVMHEIYLLDLGETIAVNFNKELLYQLTVEQQNVPAQALYCQVINFDMSKVNSQEYMVKKQYFEIIDVESECFKVKFYQIKDTTTNETVNQTTSYQLEMYVTPSPVYIPEEETSNFSEESLYFDYGLEEPFENFNPGTYRSIQDSMMEANSLQPIKTNIMAKLVLPSNGSYIKLLPTHIVSVTYFYAHIVSNTMDYNSKPLPTLCEINIKMNSPEYVISYKQFKYPPMDGELVFALFAGKYYRAKLHSTLSDNRIKVFYVDYGNCAIISFDDIRQWDDRFDNLPFQAVSCCIADITTKDDSGIIMVKNEILNKKIEAEVLTIDTFNDLHVRIFDSEGYDIGQLLTIVNVAKPIDVK